MVGVPHVDVGGRLAVLGESFIGLEDHIDRRWEVDLGPRLRIGLFTLGVDAVYWRSGPGDFPSEGRGVLVSAAVELSSVR